MLAAIGRAARTPGMLGRSPLPAVPRARPAIESGRLLPSEPLTCRGGRQALPETVVATKLILPAPRPGHIPRARLQERLERGVERGLMLLSSTAGSGKTSLLAHWLRAQPLPVAWLSLDEGDAEVQRFLSHLVAALARIDALADAADAAREQLDSRQQPPIEAILGGLINAIAAGGVELLLVLDDLHRVDSAEVHQALIFLVERRPPSLRLVIASRSDPPLPLARMRLRGGLSELRAADLRFTVDEAAEFVAEVSGHRLAERELRALVERTEGWAAGLQAAALALKGREDPAAFVASFTGSHRYVLDFLDEEVVDRQPEALRAFLLRCSILDELSGDLCDAVTAAEAGSSAVMLERCERENLFVVALDADRSRFTFHRLFADRLRHRLEREHPAELPELHRRAAGYFAARGRMREAIEHGLAAGQVDRVAEWIGSVAEAMIVRREIGSLAAWIEALPEAELRRRPGLCIAYARVLQLENEHDRAESWLQAAEARVPDVPTAEGADLRGQIAAVRARAASWRGDVARTITLGRQALELLGETASQRAEVTLSLGLAHHMQGEVIEASDRFAEAARQLRGKDRVFEASVLGMQAEALKLAGRLREAERLARRALELGRGRDDQLVPALGRVQIVLGNVLLAMGEIEEARASADEALELGERGQSAVIRFAGQLLAAHLHEAAGDLDRAHQALDDAEQVLGSQALPAVMEGLVRFRAALDARFGRPGALVRWARDYEQARDEDDEATSYDREARDMLLARARLVEGRPEAAEAMLLAILPASQAAGRLENALHARLLLALAQHAAGKTDAALETLGEALAFAEREGYVQVFVEQGAPMAALLRQLVARGSGSAWAGQLLGRMQEDPVRPTPSAPAGAAALSEPLTEREMEVLHLLAAGYSNREIADSLVIAVGTVKRHVTNINGKLESGSRSRAVARARELGLIA